MNLLKRFRFGENTSKVELLFRYSLIGTVICTVIVAFFTNGRSIYCLLHSDAKDTFMDFFNSILDAMQENPYTQRGVIYPPITYLYYRIWGKLLPVDVIHLENARLVRDSQSGIVLAVVMTGLTIFLLLRILKNWLKDSVTYRTMLWVILASVPFWYAYERGNLSLQTLLFLTYFILYYQSGDRIKKELALISLAVAVAFKIYPVVFGLLLLLEKKYKEALRCVIYGVVIFFVPFLMFGGMSSVVTMLQNIMSTSDKMLQLGFGYKVNIDNTLGFLGSIFQIPVSESVHFTAKLWVALCCLFVLIYTRKTWQRYMVLCGFMTIFPSFSYTYTLIFMLIPLLFFFRDNPKTTNINVIFTLMFVAMFAPLPLGGVKLFEFMPDAYYHLNFPTFISSLSLIGMIVLMMIDVYLDRFPVNRTRCAR